MNEDMKLPVGKVCIDCVFYKDCKWFFRCKADSVVCDWAPSRFKPRRSQTMKITLADALKVSDKAWEADSDGKLSGVTRADIWTLIKAIQERDVEIKKLTSALEHIAGIVKLDAFTFNELAAKVYESALGAIGRDEVPARYE